MPERRPADDRRISWHPTATGRCRGSHRWATGRSSSGHRLKFLSSAKWIGRSPDSHLAVAARRPVHDFYDMVQGRKNPAMICRCQKTGIGWKSGDHRTIYKACDVGIISAHRSLCTRKMIYLTEKLFMSLWICKMYCWEISINSKKERVGCKAEMGPNVLVLTCTRTHEYF